MKESNYDLYFRISHLRVRKKERNSQCGKLSHILWIRVGKLKSKFFVLVRTFRNKQNRPKYKLN